MFGDETDWMVGNTQNILDNMIAKGEIKQALSLWESFYRVQEDCHHIIHRMQADNLVQSILPFIEANFNVSDQPQGRGVGDSPAGGMTTNNVIKLTLMYLDIMASSLEMVLILQRIMIELQILLVIISHSFFWVMVFLKAA